MAGLLEVGIAQSTSPGEAECGDCCVVKMSGRRALIGVIDGLGHGAEAAKAAHAAAEVLETFGNEAVGSLMERCHEKLRGTRGAAITLMEFDGFEKKLKWIGAGNIAAVLVHVAQADPPQRKELLIKELLIRGGVAGAWLPSMNASTMEIGSGDIVIAATDGVRVHFIEAVSGSESPQRLAERLLAGYRTNRDDALVMVARVRGRDE